MCWQSLKGLFRLFRYFLLVVCKISKICVVHTISNLLYSAQLFKIELMILQVTYMFTKITCYVCVNNLHNGSPYILS